MSPAPIKPIVSGDILKQIDIRVGMIEAVLDVPEAPVPNGTRAA